MNKLLAFIFLIFLCRCAGKTERETNVYSFGGSSEVEIIVVDSCEYLAGWRGSNEGGPIATHRGRCFYCQKRLERTLLNLMNSRSEK